MPDDLTFKHHIIDADGPENPHIKAAGDIDGDGRPDIVVASSAGGPLVWDRDPEWTRHEIAPSGKWSTDAQLVDMDGDGDLDVLISEWYGENRLEWWENPAPSGDPTRDPWTLHVIGEPRAHDIQVGDIDGDGQMEIVTRQQGEPGNEIVIRKLVEGTWIQRVIPCPEGEGLGVGDLDGDGRADIVIGGTWWQAPVDPMKDDWTARTFCEWSPDAVVALADMNGNGRLDVVLSRSEGSYRLSWFDVPADPTSDAWKEHVVDDDVDYAHSLAVADMNGDGLLDVVTAEMHQSERRRVLVYLNGGDGTWARQVVATTGSHKLCVADVGSTGKADLIGANWSGDNQPVEMWLQE